MPRDQFVDTVAHEPSHVLSGVEQNDPFPKHGKKWYFQYRKNRSKLFKEYIKFINSSQSLPIKYKKSYGNLYSSQYEAAYSEMIRLKKVKK